MTHLARITPAATPTTCCFDQITFQLGTVEIVLYNPRDRQAIASHALIDGNRRCSGAD